VQDYSTPVPERLQISPRIDANSTLYKTDIINRIRDGLDSTVRFAKAVLSPESDVKSTTIATSLYTENYELTTAKVTDQFTSAKPVDYLVAGTEGLAWVVHLCYLLSLKRGRNPNPRGPVLIRALILLLVVVSVLLLRSHIKNKPKDDVLPNLSLGFSISVVTLLILYIITLIPSASSSERISSRNVTVRILAGAVIAVSPKKNPQFFYLRSCGLVLLLVRHFLNCAALSLLFYDI